MASILALTQQMQTNYFVNQLFCNTSVALATQEHRDTNLEAKLNALEAVVLHLDTVQTIQY